MCVQSLGREDALEEGMAPTPVFSPGESQGQRSLAGYSPWGRKESDTTEVTEHTRMHVAGIPLGWKHFISHSTTERVIS